jgi:hypothetical protein
MENSRIWFKSLLCCWNGSSAALPVLWTIRAVCCAVFPQDLGPDERDLDQEDRRAVWPSSGTSAAMAGCARLKLRIQK